MNYTKPEVAVLGEAVSVIEMIGTGKPSTKVFDGVGQSYAATAYDLDE
ncbi:MAG: hypothetical protein WCF26_24115 [Candidatus Sulfotelmatobacter sp.]